MRGLISAVIVAVTVVFQLTVVDRIAFPGGSGPDLVLVVVAALALASGPLAGAMIGFWAGLALDVAPPGSHFTGQDALVFCLIGYACGLLADGSSDDSMAEPGHTALFEIVVTAAGAICGEALVALLGVMLSDPQVTWSAITRVLPVAVAYDVLLCPFVLYAAAAVWRLAGVRGGAARVSWSSASSASSAARSVATVPGAAFATGGSSPRLSQFHLGHPQLGHWHLGRSDLGRSLLGGSVFSHPPTAGLAGKGSAFGRERRLTQRRLTQRRPTQLRPKQLRPGKRLSRGRRLFAPSRSTPTRLKSPSRGWLRRQGRRRGLARGLSSTQGRRWRLSRWLPSRRRAGGYPR